MKSDKKELHVEVVKDDKTGVWSVAKSDVPGLHLEADSVEQLVSLIVDCVPELINED